MKTKQVVYGLIAVLFFAWTLAFAACEGPAGPKGKQGEQGIKGEQGGQGQNGADGPNGAKGEDGAKGQDGNKGADGQNGEEGEAPYIGDCGNWHIGGVADNCDGDWCTGVKAGGEINPNDYNWQDIIFTTCVNAGLQAGIGKNDPTRTTLRPVPIDPKAHDWDEWEETTPATETTFGVETRICKRDPSHTETRDIVSSGAVVLGKGTLRWYDDFSGDSLDTTKWNIDTGTGVQYDSTLWAWGNKEKQWYHENNIRVEDGNLIIEAKKQSPAIGTMNYTSGRLTTAGVKNATTNAVTAEKYITPKTGYVEARLKAPRGAGFWPCFFMLGANYLEYSGFEKKFWPYCGEIDIFEANGAKLTSPDHAVHYGTAHPDQYWYKYQEIPVTDISANWHIYGVGWDSTGIRFYINGENTFTVALPFAEEAYGANSAAFYDGPGFTVIFCLAVGGGFLGNNGDTVPADSVFTSNDWEARSLMVDWVRVYE